MINAQLKAWKIFRTSKALHFYDDDNIDRLNLLLGNQNSVEALATVGKQNGSSEAIWFVHIPFADESYIANVFRRTPLRLDSLVFAIVQGIKNLLMQSKGTIKNTESSLGANALLYLHILQIMQFTTYTTFTKLMKKLRPFKQSSMLSGMLIMVLIFWKQTSGKGDRI